ncbi:MAG TPA: LacI family DNA-binding transcriptional regulator [Actinophytocola sp.]|uniref:LacI family DNA-binding transcriptional regulator n=1 Tax=Actinophytocola sp. TaxID=1872138 RepID=UPI002DBDD4B5|nr:LacI family DNA-binding transcriptional regulator [Actinophytocola sp.]HEU5472293.1 LacI family DNA-binding transcriptional regulator [Actinophytocola sp.]
MTDKIPTVHDVARRAGVSTATVSRALSNSDKLHPVTLERVLRAVEELGYLPNGAARGLTSRRTRVLALCFLDLGDPESDAGDDAMLYIDGVVRGMERAARERGYAILIGAVQDPDAALDLAVSLASRSDGIVLLGQAAPNSAIQRLKRLPVVVVAGRCDDDHGRVDQVRVDNAGGMTALVDHLVSVHGHTRLGYLGGPADSPDATERWEAFRRTVTGLGLPVPAPLPGDFTQHTGHAAAPALSPLPDAVVCANDQMAIGLMTALAERGIRVPADVAVVGFDDIDLGRHLRPALTTVRQPMQPIGAAAVTLLERRLRSAQLPPTDLRLPTTLQVRGSCGCPA